MNIKNTFLAGRMNKDSNKRLLKDGEYYHAENLRFFNDSEDGIAVSIDGNIKISSDVSDIENPFCVGIYFNQDKNKIYYWVTGDNNIDKIIEYDTATGQSEIVLHGDLNLSKNNLVLGINEIDGLLFWTDSGRNNPRFCNIERAKTYGFNGFTEDDISVVKSPPFYEPTITPINTNDEKENDLKERIICFAYQYKYLDGDYSSISFYSDWAYFSRPFNVNNDTLQNDGMVNAFNAAQVEFNTGSKRVTDIRLLYRDSNSNSVYIVQEFNKEEEGWGDNENQTYIYINNKTYAQLPTDQVTRLYDRVPFKPFTQEMIGNRLIYGNYYDGYNLKDCNGKDTMIDFNAELVSTPINEQLLEIERVESNTAVRVGFENVELNQGKNLLFDLYLVFEDPLDNTQTIKIKITDNISLDNNYNSLFEFSQSQEFIDFNERVNEKVNNIFPLPLDAEWVTPIDVQFNVLTPTTTNLFISQPIGGIYQIDNTPSDPNDNDFTIEQVVFLNYGSDTYVYDLENNVARSLHSNRSYEAAILYFDKNNYPISPQVSKENTIFIPHENAITKNQIKITIPPALKAPCFAEKYKIVLKESRKDYETIYANVFYVDGLYVWLKMEGDNQNKVKKGDKLILKRDVLGFVYEYIEVEVLDYRNQSADFIEGNKTPQGTDLIEEAGIYIKIAPDGFSATYGEGEFLRYTDHDSSNKGVPKVVLGHFSVQDENGAWSDIPISPDTRIDLSISNYTNAQQGDTETILEYADSEYSNLQEWFEAENINLGVFDDNYTFFRGLPTSIIGQDAVRETGDPNDALYLRISSQNIDGFLERESLNAKLELRLVPGYMVFETYPKITEDLTFYENPETFIITEDGLHQGKEQDQTLSRPAIITLDAYNCYSYGNGVESYKIKDAFNSENLKGKDINFEFRGAIVTTERDKQRHRKADMTWTGVYNEDTGFNGLNQFNASTLNWRRLDQEDGSIQRIYSRDNDIVVFQEDKVGVVLFGKSVIYDQQGLEVLQESDDVLGSYRAYAGEYGISQNPESLAVWGSYIYFTDAQRGVVLRLDGSGINEISKNLLEKFTKDYFRNTISLKQHGGYDPINGEYLLYGDMENSTLSYQEGNQGYPTFYTYQPDCILGVNNNLYTWKNGEMYEHEKSEIQNDFYGQQYESKIIYYANQSPSDVKIFKAIAIEGNMPFDILLKTDYTETDLQKEDFKQKEDFWYTHLRKSTINNYGAKYGIGIVNEIQGNDLILKPPFKLSVGDEIYNNSGLLIGFVSLYDEGKITLTDTTQLNQGDYVYGVKKSRIEGSPLRGYYARVEMSVLPIRKLELFAVNLEVVKSYL